jgi:hypothetical protein
MAFLFSTALVTFDGNESKFVKGKPENIEEFDGMLSKIENKQRVIGFVFSSSA